MSYSISRPNTTQQVVLVDQHNNRLGLMNIMEAHRNTAVLHRAISVILYRKKNHSLELLLQKRSIYKPLWPLYFSNTICTHPRDGESDSACAVRRLYEEMGIRYEEANLRHIYALTYHAAYNDTLSEYEYDNIFLGTYDGDVLINPKEVKSSTWMELSELQKDIANTQKVYTPWFRTLMNTHAVVKALV